MTAKNRAPFADLSFVTYGDSSNPHAVLVHGMGESGAEVHAIAETMAKSHYVFVPDLPGHGATAGDLTGITMERLAAVVADFAQQQGVRDALFVGHSLGGVLVTEIAATRKDLLARAVLVDPGMLFLQETKTNLAALYASLNESNFKSYIDEVLPPIMFDEHDSAELKERIMAGMFGIGVQAFVALGNCIISYEADEKVAAISAPTLLIYNSQPLVRVEVFKALKPDVSLHLVPDVSHQGVVAASSTLEAIESFIS